MDSSVRLVYTVTVDTYGDLERCNQECLETLERICGLNFTTVHVQPFPGQVPPDQHVPMPDAEEPLPFGMPRPSITTPSGSQFKVTTDAIPVGENGRPLRNRNTEADAYWDSVREGWGTSSKGNPDERVDL